MTLFGENIAFLRKKAALSQAEYAKIFSIDRTTVGGWEVGKSTPSMDMLIKIALYFDVNLHELVFSDLATSKGNSAKVIDDSAKVIEESTPNNVHLIENNVHLIEKNSNLTNGFSNLSAHSSPVRTQTLYGVVANAGEAVPSDLWHEQEALSVPGAPHGGIIVKVHGDSMYPTIHSDDYIVCTRLESTQEIKWQDIHLIITSQSMVYVKRLRLHTRGIELCSDNHQVGSIYLQREEIVQVWHVMFKVSSLMRLQPPTTDLTARISYVEAYLSAIFGDFTAGQPPV